MTKRPEHFPPELSSFKPPMQKGYIKGKYGFMGFGELSFYIAQIPVKQAREIIIKNHYSHTVVNNSYIHLGVFIKNVLQGVLQFGYAKNPACGGSIVAYTGNTQYLELNRMWLSDKAPHNSESKAISYAIKYIKEVCPQVRWVQSFADERCKALGVVYQAANFIYLGYHLTHFYELDGKTYHNQQMTRKANNSTSNSASYLQANKNRATKHYFKQFRYIYFIKKQYKKDLKFKPKPYPKPNAKELYKSEKIRG